MKLRIYLMRHGETDYNKEGDSEICQGQDSSLNDLGFKQAICLADELKDIKIDKLYSSDLKRAMQTAEFLSQTKELEINKDERLREYYSGSVKPSSEKWIEEYRKLFDSGISKYDIRLFGGENIWDFIKRTKSFIKDLENESGNIAIVGHGGLNSTFINLSQGKEKDEFSKIKQDNTCINILEFDGINWYIREINNSKHISKFKPEVNIYYNQNIIKDIAKKFIVEEMKLQNLEYSISGDLVNNAFGYYDRPYKRYVGSTINIISNINLEISPNWKLTKFKNNLITYEVGKLIFEEIEHKILLMMPHDKKNYFNLANKNTENYGGEN